MYLGFWRLNALDALPLLGVAPKYASEVSNSGNPGNSEVAAAYKAHLERIRQLLLTSKLNNPRPVLSSMLESIGALQFIGNGLFSGIMSAISGNPAAPALAVQDLQKLQVATQDFYQQVVAIDSAFSKLQVEYDDLDEGEGELGLLIPRVENASSLKELSGEFKQWGIALAPLTELFDPSAGPLQVKTCATTDWMIYLAATPPLLAGIQLCLKGVNSILREFVEGRRLIEQLIQRQAPKIAIDALEGDSKQKLDKEMRRLAEEIVQDNFKGPDVGRKNELKNAVSGSLKHIASKVSSGTKLELRFIPNARSATEPNDADGGSQSAQGQDELEALSSQLDQDVDLLSFSADSAVIQGLLYPPSSSEDDSATN